MQSFVRALVLAFLAFSPLIAGAYASNGRRSGMNGARLAHGLPPAPPKRLYNPELRKARDDSPSGIATVTSSSSSIITTPTPPPPPPPTPQSVYIGIYDTTVPDQPTLIGYCNSQGLEPYKNNLSVYTYTVPETAGTPIEIEYLSGYVLAPSVSPTEYKQAYQLATLGPGRDDFVALVNVVPGSTETVDNYNNPVIAETDVWIVDPTTGDLSIRWTNPGGAIPQTYLFVNTYGGDILLTGEPATLASQLGFTVNLVPVMLKLIPV